MREDNPERESAYTQTENVLTEIKDSLLDTINFELDKTETLNSFGNQDRLNDSVLSDSSVNESIKSKKFCKRKRLFNFFFPKFI